MSTKQKKHRISVKKLAAGVFVLICSCMMALGAAGAANGVKEFSVKDGVIYADGKPFPFILHFCFSAPDIDNGIQYWSQIGGTGWLLGSVFHLSNQKDFETLDQALENCAKYGVYLAVRVEIATFFGASYMASHPDAVMQGPGGSKVSRKYASFVHEGYRQALANGLKELALHVKDNLYFLGYFLQDEFAYPGWGGYEPVSVAVFQDRMLQQYGNIEGVNAAWGTKYIKKEDITPPEKEEPGRRFADWQIYRRWAYMDIIRLCYQTLKTTDPNHLVIHSMDFWGSAADASAWWDVPQSVDIMTRHGIAYSMGYNLFLLREIAEWGGKAGSAMCMPPGFEPSFSHFMYFLDTGRNGLSYVGAHGPQGAGYYRGPADDSDGYRRREPQYTPAKAVIQLADYLGETYLKSKRLSPQVGYLVGDRSASIEGVNQNAVAGMLELLTDLNVDFSILSEHNYAPLSRFKSLIIGPALNLASDKMVRALEEYMQGGGSAIILPGACGRNEWNEEMKTDRFSLMARYGHPVKCDQLVVGKQELAAGGQIRPIKAQTGEKILGWVKGRTNEAAVVLADGGGELIFGWDIGGPYQRGWTVDFTGVGVVSEEERQTRLVQALGADGAKQFSAEAISGVLPQRLIAAVIQDYLKTQGVTPTVRAQGHEAPAKIRAQAFVNGDELLIGIANRMVRPGQTLVCYKWDLEKGGEGTWPRDYNVPIINPQVSVRLPDGYGGKLRGFRMPNMRVEGDSLQAIPEELPVNVEHEGKQSYARFAPGQIDDWASVVLAPEYKPLVGLELDRREVVRGETVKIKMSILNGTGKERKGRLVLGDDGLRLKNNGFDYSVNPGETKLFDLAVKVPENAANGYYNLKAVATDEDGSARSSMGLELRVEDAIEVTISPAKGLLYARPGETAKMKVKVALRNDGCKGKIRAMVIGFKKFIPDLQEQEWELGKDKEHTFSFTFKAPGGQAVSEAGVIAIEEHIIGAGEKRHMLSCRASSGSVSYREQILAQPVNSVPEVKRTDFVCLENEQLIVRLDPATGTIHSMIVRQTGMELLSPDVYPMGFKWYTWGGWQLENMESNCVELASSSVAGNPVTMKVGLFDNYLDIVYDAVKCEPATHSIYLISRISDNFDYKECISFAPIKGKIEEGKKLLPKAQDLSGDWVAVADKASRHILVVFFEIPSLNDVMIMPVTEAPYTIFNLKKDVSPGRLHFRLAGGTGGMERVSEWKTGWDQRK